jgi:2,3-bisphosphoglycerate-dependent phosphoglycerate mutase
MTQLVLLRHGQSLWNLEGRFTGWKDIDLSQKGIAEAKQAGRVLKSSGYTFDAAYTSMLKRAIRTLWIVLDKTDLMWIPVVKCWQLNERNYGALEGRSKRRTEERYGKEQVHKWRRSFKDRPPSIDQESYLCLQRDPRYSGLESTQTPTTESLEDTLARLKPCWRNIIASDLNKGKKVLIVSHGNTLRALIKLIEGIGDEEIEKVEIPTGIPLVYSLDEDLIPIEHFYLRWEEDLHN